MINIYSLINNSRKSGDKVRLSAYQNLLAELQKYETSKGAEPLTETQQIKIFQKYAKTLEDSISQFKQANRDDLVADYTTELDIVKELLPEPVSGDKLIDFVLSDNYFQSYKINENLPPSIPKKEMGACIKYVKEKFPTADGKDISNIIKSMVI